MSQVIPETPIPDKSESTQAAVSVGRLKIYLGMSAGVGKTYAMLNDALLAKQRGIDVVAGYIEPHGRKDTESLAAQLEQIPLREIEYRGIKLREFDLDAAIRRRPAVLLVDELAHSNAAGSRHVKRFEDIRELLRNGIDVFTTVNVQHIESLKDVVEKITGIAVSETVPDSFFASADEVELVDIPPDELLERLREGKVYHAGKVDSALNNFFQKGNLLALRELVLRHTAERVDAQMQKFRSENAVPSVWPTTERIIVCVAPNALSSRVVREAARLAQSLHAELIAVSVESPRYSSLGEGARHHAREALQLAERLGGETIVRTAADVVSTILSTARERNASSIVIGKAPVSRFRRLTGSSIVDELLEQSGEINIHVVPVRDKDRQAIKAVKPKGKSSKQGMLAALLITGAVTCFAVMVSPYLASSNIVMIYLAAVALISSRYGRRESLLAAVLSVLSFDFFLVPPQYSLTVSDVQYLVTFVVMLSVGLLISTLNLRVRAQAQIVSDRERRTAALYDLLRNLSQARNQEALIKVAGENIEQLFRRPAIIFLPDNNGAVRPLYGESQFIRSGADSAAADWVFRHRAPAGAGTNTLPGANFCYLPLLASDKVVGVLAISAVSGRIEVVEADLLRACANQLAFAVERSELLRESQEKTLLADREKLRSTLLSAVSHDIRTPLASITGAATALMQANHLSTETRHELEQSIAHEAERLELMVRNVLDITRLEGAPISLKLEWNLLEELVGSAAARTARLLGKRQLRIHIPAHFPLLLVDGLLIEQVFVNILENAARYTPETAAVDVEARSEGDKIIISLRDHGPGIPPDQEEAIFKKLYRAHQSGTGFGLGLAICRAIIEAHNGSIRAQNHPAGGAEFEIILPAATSQPELPHE